MIFCSLKRQGEQPVTTFVPLFPWMSMQISTILTFEGRGISSVKTSLCFSTLSRVDQCAGGLLSRKMLFR